MSKRLNGAKHGTKQQTVQQTQPIPKELNKGVLVAEVTIRGIRPLLMSSPQMMFPKGTIGDRYYPHLDPDRRSIKVKGGKGIKRNPLEDSPEVQAENAAYREKINDPSSPLVIPRRCIHATVLEGAKHVKLEGRGAKLLTMMKGSISEEPENCILLDPETDKPLLKYEIHVAKVKIKSTGGSIMRYRPVIDNWKTTFEIRWLPTLMGVTEDHVRASIEKAGKLGILDFRPSFGTFEVERFDVREV